VPLDRARLEAAARVIIGLHDFKSFSVKSSTRPHTRCDIREARWVDRPEGLGVALEIRADRFLHHMVRMRVGTMVEVALDRRSGDDMARLLARDPGVVTGPPAPAAGLYFVTAVYPDEWFALPDAS
jgi:tRNA pseudouridine38-40 synthase